MRSCMAVQPPGFPEDLGPTGQRDAGDRRGHRQREIRDSQLLGQLRVDSSRHIARTGRPVLRPDTRCVISRLP